MLSAKWRERAKGIHADVISQMRTDCIPDRHALFACQLSLCTKRDLRRNGDSNLIEEYLNHPLGLRCRVVVELLPMADNAPCSFAQKLIRELRASR